MGSPGGRHETVTLQAETTTPRARSLSASFVRERTPSGELPPARRQRMKNEDKARARALVRLSPIKHEQYLEKEKFSQPKVVPVPRGSLRSIPPARFALQFATPRSTYQQFCSNVPERML